MKRALPFLILGACLVVGVLPALAADRSVAIHDFSYAPAEVAVMPGQTVSWKADGAYMHSVHFDGEATGLAPPSTTFSASRTFGAEGAFQYHCDVHAYMHGTVYVNPTGTVPTPAPTSSPVPSPPSPPAGTTAPVFSFRAKAAVRKRKVLLTLTVSAGQPVRVRGTLKRGGKRVRSVSLLARPGKHTLRLRGKKLEPGRYTLALKAGDVRRTVRFRVRR